MIHKRFLSPLQRHLATWGSALIVLVLGAAILQSVAVMRGSREAVGRTRDVLVALESTALRLTEIESAQRTLLITGDTSTRSARTALREGLARDVSRLRELYGTTPARHSRLDSLEALAGLRLAILDRQEALLATEGREAAHGAVSTMSGRQIMAGVRGLLGEIRADEEGALAAQLAREDRAARITRVVVIAGTLAAVAVALLINLLLTRYAAAQARDARRLEQQNEMLEEQALELELQQERLSEQAVELEAQATQLEEQASELEASNDELTMIADELSMANERLRVANHELEERRVAAEEANAAKAHFLATMSHELRTPLNAIAGYADLMQLGIRGSVSPEQLEDLERIKSNGRHLLGLINDILNFAKLEAGELPIRADAVAVDEEMRAVEALVAPQMGAKGLHYEYIGCDPSIHVLADPERLRQILVNLLGNALKFTDVGGRIRLACTPEAASVRIQVSDTGCGIPSEKLEAIFEPFVQVHREFTATTTQQGVGLGLAISREVARRMGGDLLVESSLGVGSTFTLLLPRTQAPVVAPDSALRSPVETTGVRKS